MKILTKKDCVNYTLKSIKRMMGKYSNLYCEVIYKRDNFTNQLYETQIKIRLQESDKIKK